MNLGGFVIFGIIIGYLGINTIVEGIKSLFENKDEDKKD